MLKTVLLVDPDWITRTLMKYHLRRAGYTVYEADSCTLAAQLNEQYQPEFIILDEAISTEHSNALNCRDHQNYILLTDLPQPRTTGRLSLAKPITGHNLISQLQAYRA
jgi:CheY-like chemotaxis protein